MAIIFITIITTVIATDMAIVGAVADLLGLLTIVLQVGEVVTATR
jgi:nicotinamide riboside transporter PnuC